MEPPEKSLPLSDTVSVDDVQFEPDVIVVGTVGSEYPGGNDDVLADIIIEDEPDPAPRRKALNVELPDERDPKAGPPNLGEWNRFFSKFVIRLAEDFFISVAFRGIDEDDVSATDLAKLHLTDQEKTAIATPLSELANRNKFMRKHGRQIVAVAGSMDAFIIFGMWVSRVNRIARKYRRQANVRRPTESEMSSNGSSGPTETPGTSGSVEGTLGGKLAPGTLRVVNPGG